jgi:chromosome segregation ATPase
MNLLNIKSDEISKLQITLDAERNNNKVLASTNQELQDALASVQSITSQPSPDAVLLAELQTQLALERAAWEKERSELVASRDEHMHSKMSADTDRDFFRDQYAQASGYVSTVRDENLQLEQRALVAEGKAKDGVGMIKAMFEGQIKTLQGDLAQWKGIAELLREKDRRTGDEIRQKAAEEPELRERYAKSLREINKLKEVVLELAREKNILQLKLDSFREDVGRTIDGLNSERALPLNGSDTDQGDELVYRCLWRPGGDSVPCLKIFNSHQVRLCSRHRTSHRPLNLRTLKDLEMHVYLDEHLVSRPSDLQIPSQGDVNGYRV